MFVIEKHLRVSIEKFCMSTWIKTKVIKHLEAFTEKEIPKQIWLDGLLVNEQYCHCATLNSICKKRSLHLFRKAERKCM